MNMKKFGYVCGAGPLAIAGRRLQAPNCRDQHGSSLRRPRRIP